MEFRLNHFLLTEFDLPLNPSRIFPTIEELRKYPPNIVIARCMKNVTFSTPPEAVVQSMLKKRDYIMSLGNFLSLNRDRKDVLKPSPIKFKNVYKPYYGQDLNGKSILFSRTGGIGDILFIQPFIRKIKEIYNDCFVYFSCLSKYFPLFVLWPGNLIDEVISLPFEIKYLFKSDYHAIFEGVIERTREAEKVNVYRLFAKWLNLAQYMKDPDDYRPILDLSGVSFENVNKFMEENNVNPFEFVVVQLRASSILRTPRYEFWIPIFKSIISDFGLKVVIVDGKYADNLISTIISSIFSDFDKNSVISFSPYSNSIIDAACLVSKSKLCISVDSALSHIAPALNVPLIGVYGAFDPIVRLETYENVDWVIPDEGSCRFCFSHSQMPCQNSKDGFPSCYDSIKFDTVMDKVERIIKRRIV